MKCSVPNWYLKVIAKFSWKYSILNQNLNILNHKTTFFPAHKGPKLSWENEFPKRILIAKKCLGDNRITGTVDDSTLLFQLKTAKGISDN